MNDKKSVLIIGTDDDKPSMFIKNKIEQRGYSAFLFDTTKYPYNILTSFDTTSPIKGFFQQDPYSPKIPLENIGSVFRRWSKGIYAPPEEDKLLYEVVYWNIESAIGAFFRCLDCLWINSQEATEMHKYKGYQLKLLKKENIRIPETLITNDPEELKHFYEKFNKKVIFKPVRGWAHTEILTDEMMNSDKLETLSRTPVKLQEFIPGKDIRVYIINKEIFPMEIISETIDFRETENAPRVKTILPDNIQADCFKIAKTLNLVYTAIDLRRTPDDEYVFFEANPTPVFIFDELSSGFPLSDRIVDLLIQGSLE